MTKNIEDFEIKDIWRLAGSTPVLIDPAGGGGITPRGPFAVNRVGMQPSSWFGVVATTSSGFGVEAQQSRWGAFHQRIPRVNVSEVQYQWVILSGQWLSFSMEEVVWWYATTHFSAMWWSYVMYYTMQEDYLRSSLQKRQSIKRLVQGYVRLPYGVLISFNITTLISAQIVKFKSKI